MFRWMVCMPGVYGQYVGSYMLGLTVCQIYLFPLDPELLDTRQLHHTSDDHIIVTVFRRLILQESQGPPFTCPSWNTLCKRLIRYFCCFSPIDRWKLLNRHPSMRGKPPHLVTDVLWDSEFASREFHSSHTRSY